MANTYSQVQICNSALIKIGEPVITAIDEDSKAARLCNQQWDLLRDSTLRAHPWNFAQKRAVLALSATTPAFEWSYQHALPTDFLRVTSFYDGVGNYRYPDDVPYRIEGDYIMSEDSVMRMVYTARITDTSKFDALYAEALAYRIAADLAIPIAQSRSLRTDMLAGFGDSLAVARSVDAQEDYPPMIAARGWLNARK